MYVPTIPRVLVLPIVTASLAAAVGCSCLTPEESASLESAGRNYTLGNYSDALGTYTRLAHGLETRGCSEAHLARLREAACLIRLGRHEEAARALERVPLRELEPELQREFWFADATNSLALGRDTEPVFESDEAEKRRRKADATALYRKARRSFELVLETKPDDYEALLGRGLASLRLGILNSDDQFLQMATDTLRLCKSQRDDDKRATFSLGLAILHGPGRGQLTRNAADLMLDALRSDIEGNFDYHEAYFDLLVFLHPFATPPELARGFAQRSDLLPTAGSLVDHLEEYAVRGRVTEGASNQERLQQIRNWLAVHRQWAADERDAKQRVVLANDTIRQGGRPVVDKYTAAMEIVEGVKAPFRSEQAYVDCRGDVQRGYVEVLMRFSDLLTSIRELDSAQRFVQTAMKRAERPWIADPSPVIIAASTLDSRIEAYRGFDRMTTQCRELIAKDEPEDARRKFDIYELRIKGTPEQVFVDERIAEFRKEIERSGEVAKISEFFDAGARERAADPKTALEKLLEAEKLALEANLPAWKEMVQRSLAELYFETGRYQESLETLRRLQQSSTLRKPSDALLQAQCYLRTGEIEGVCTLLGEISDTSFFNDRDKAFAGTSFLAFAKRATKEPERRERLARAREFLEAAAPRDSAVIEARKTCYRELWQSLTSAGGDPRALENVLESLVLLAQGARIPALREGELACGLGRRERCIVPSCVRSPRGARPLGRARAHRRGEEDLRPASRVLRGLHAARAWQPLGLPHDERQGPRRLGHCRDRRRPLRSRDRHGRQSPSRGLAGEPNHSQALRHRAHGRERDPDPLARADAASDLELADPQDDVRRARRRDRCRVRDPGRHLRELPEDRAHRPRRGRQERLLVRAGSRRGQDGERRRELRAGLLGGRARGCGGRLDVIRRP